MEKSLQSVLEADQGLVSRFKADWRNVHALFMETLEENWREYINFLDMKVTELVRSILERSTYADACDAVHEGHPLASETRIQCRET
jgi:hypothetical protein